MATRRNLNKESFWRQVTREQAGSGLSARAWCRKHRVKEMTFYWWRRELARRGTEHAQASFVPVHVTNDDTAAGASQIEIMLADGRRVRIAGRVDRQMLADVLAVVEGASC